MEAPRFGIHTRLDAPSSRSEIAVDGRVKDAPVFPESLQGAALKNAVRKGWKYISKIPTPITTHRPLFEAFAEHLDELDDTIWRTPRDVGAINGFYASACMVFQYTHLETNGQIIRPSQLTTAEQSWYAIQTTLDDPQKRDIFYENAWKSPITFVPLRKVAPQLILRHHFGNEAITGVDIGASTGITLPLQNSAEYTDVSFNGREKLMQLFGNSTKVNVVHGLNVDKNTREENILWSKANKWWSPHYDEIDYVIGGLEPEMDKFPYLSVDITEGQALVKMQEELQRSGRPPEVSFVLSSYVRHQLKHDQPTQQSFVDTVTGILGENGLWIDTGEELLRPDSTQFYGVNVYQKRDKKLRRLGVPFIVEEAGNIHQANLDYFRAA